VELAPLAKEDTSMRHHHRRGGVLKTTLLLASLLVVFGLQAAAPSGAAPTPAYSVTCVSGGQTTLTWKGAKVTSVTMRWFSGEDLFAQAGGNTSSSKKPRGTFTLATPTDSTRAGAGVVLSDGSEHGIDPVACT
jgi:hypothetical protein